MAPNQSVEGGGPWVNFIDNKDDRIHYQVGDAAKTGLPDASTDVVLLQFLPNKLPHLVTMHRPNVIGSSFLLVSKNVIHYKKFLDLISLIITLG